MLFHSPGTCCTIYKYRLCVCCVCRQRHLYSYHISHTTVYTRATHTHAPGRTQPAVERTIFLYYALFIQLNRAVHPVNVQRAQLYRIFLRCNCVVRMAYCTEPDGKPRGKKSQTLCYRIVHARRPKSTWRRWIGFQRSQSHTTRFLLKFVFIELDDVLFRCS